MSMTLYIKKNILTLSSLLLVVCVVFIYRIKPDFIYNPDGSYKEFGLGKKSKTIFPIWLCILIIAILIYTFFRFIILLPRIR